MNLTKFHTILYVEDQEKSTLFYENILERNASLNVPGMTEFDLSDSFTLGLMPNNGIAKILGDHTPHPNTGEGIPRCELYFYTDDIAGKFNEIKDSGIRIISSLEKRNWGDDAFYIADPDGHIIAFAQKIKNNEP